MKKETPTVADRYAQLKLDAMARRKRFWKEAKEFSLTTAIFAGFAAAFCGIVWGVTLSIDAYSDHYNKVAAEKQAAEWRIQSIERQVVELADAATDQTKAINSINGRMATDEKLSASFFAVNDASITTASNSLSQRITALEPKPVYIATNYWGYFTNLAGVNGMNWIMAKTNLIQGTNKVVTKEKIIW